MPIVRASQDLDDGQIEKLKSAAIYQAMTLQEFLGACLKSGMAHAVVEMENGHRGSRAPRQACRGRRGRYYVLECSTKGNRGAAYRLRCRSRFDGKTVPSWMRSRLGSI